VVEIPNCKPQSVSSHMLHRLSFPRGGEITVRQDLLLAILRAPCGNTRQLLCEKRLLEGVEVVTLLQLAFASEARLRMAASPASDTWTHFGSGEALKALAAVLRCSKNAEKRRSCAVPELRSLLIGRLEGAGRMPAKLAPLSRTGSCAAYSGVGFGRSILRTRRERVYTTWHTRP
jgi:hypothetical protein